MQMKCYNYHTAPQHKQDNFDHNILRCICAQINHTPHTMGQDDTKGERKKILLVNNNYFAPDIISELIQTEHYI